MSAELLSPESFGPLEVSKHPQVHYASILENGRLLHEASSEGREEPLSLGQALLLRAQKKKVIQSLSSRSAARTGKSAVASLLRKEHRITFQLGSREPRFIYSVV